ncbi:Transcriptional regulator, TetR family [Candidatus Rhodobacter oscarellae]|uniref:Transcriptional regulator, TetR family n=1 Tax=Candidatus Rhodobacter oscarellae TaxID=1675527 RepID=A0A0J9E8A0_9RHOB|nr:TetR/AcrR family transcriptional regulator [Candidatus Rhodobacter lobularis]KMW58957.1 Transcriptional regulator, TetR family [Candidatus Rhodobacter lobularis]
MNVEAQIKRGRKFDQVLEGAREVFLADGYEGASVDDIARAARVSKATLYSYFPDKRLLFIEVAKQECARQAELAVQQVQMNGPLDEVLFKAASTMARFFMSQLGRQTYRMAVAESARFPEIGRAFYEGGPTIARNALVSYLVEQAEAGALVMQDVDLAADQFIEMCKAGHHVQSLLGVKTDWTEAETDHIVRGAVETFLARYAANR